MNGKQYKSIRQVSDERLFLERAFSKHQDEERSRKLVEEVYGIGGNE